MSKIKLDTLLVESGIKEKPKKLNELLEEDESVKKSSEIKLFKKKSPLEKNPENTIEEEEIEEGEEIEEEENKTKGSKKLLDLLNSAGIPTLESSFEEEDEEEPKKLKRRKSKKKKKQNEEKTINSTLKEIAKAQDYQFDTSWIEIDNLSHTNLSSDRDTQYVVHKLKADLIDLDIKVLIKLVDGDNKEYIFYIPINSITEDGKYGIYLTHVDLDKFKITTGSGGILLFISKDDGSTERRILSGSTEEFIVYYRIIVRRLNINVGEALRRGAGFTSSIPLGMAGPSGPPGPPGPPGSGTDLTVQELDGSPIGTSIKNISFNSDYNSNTVVIDGDTAIIGAPPNAPSLDSTSLNLSGATQYTGRLSQSNINYESGKNAGSSVNYIQNDTIFTLQTQNDNNYGDKGIIKVFVNGELVSAIDMGANFVESDRDGNQDLNNWNTDYSESGITYPCNNGTCEFQGSYSGLGSLEIIKVEKYNNFGLWQSWSARINISDELRKGFSEIFMTHTNITGKSDQTSNTFKFFYDDDTGANPSVTTPTVDIVTPTYKWLSGIKYFSAGSIFKTSFEVHDAFDNVYHNSNAPVVMSGWPGIGSISIPYNDSHVTGVSSPPDIDETMSVGDYTFSQSANQFSEDAKLTVQPRDPYGSYTSKTSDSGKWLIDSFNNSSDDLHEYFRDEDYRLTWDETNNNWDSPPSNKKGNWDSTQSLLTYDGGNKHSQCYNSQLIYPDKDFSTGFKPTGNPNYSLFTGTTKPSFSNFSNDDVAVFVRGYYDDGENHTSGRLHVSGITGSDLTNNKIEIYIKVPGKTGWTTLNKDYNSATYTGADGDGCRTNSATYNGPTFEFTLGTNNTDASTNWGIIVMVIMDPGSPDITGSMYIENW